MRLQALHTDQRQVSHVERPGFLLLLALHLGDLSFDDYDLQEISTWV